MSNSVKLSIRNFAQIRQIDLILGDLTVVVGAQGTGKSLALQWLKAALDGKIITQTLRDAGHQMNRPNDYIDLIFGEGMGPSWKEESLVSINGKGISPSNLSRRGKNVESVFYIPAHRSMLISDGWAMPFQKLPSDTPIVARIFSHNLFERFNRKNDDALFPVDKLMKQEYRELIDDAVYHGGKIKLEQVNYSKKLKLSYDDTSLPFMTWTAGQREFTPLLLGLYHLLPRTNKRKQEHIDWVIIEEPEMGLHPQAISVFLLLVLDLLWRGYRVVLSTHSPHVLSAVWMLQRLKKFRARPQLVCQSFHVRETQRVQEVIQSVLDKDYRVSLFEFENSKVISKNISDLDPEAEDESEAGWGGLTGYSSKFGDAVRQAANEHLK